MANIFLQGHCRRIQEIAYQCVLKQFAISYAVCDRYIMGSGNGIGKSFDHSNGSEMVLDKKGILGRDNAVFEDARKGWMHNEEKVYFESMQRKACKN